MDLKPTWEFIIIIFFFIIWCDSFFIGQFEGEEKNSKAL